MTVAEDLAAVVRLAALTDDRTRGEQAALARVAARVDREINRQISSNPHMADRAFSVLLPSTPCTYPDSVHGRPCACAGTGVSAEPVRGWSTLGLMVAETAPATGARP